MMQDEQAFLKELQQACLKEFEDYLSAFREGLATLKENPEESIRGLQKVIHSMKGNLQAVAFSHFGDFIHSLEGILDKHEKVISSLGRPLESSDASMLEFYLSNVLDAMGCYLDDLKKLGVDSEGLKNKQKDPIDILSTWAPSVEVPKIAPTATVATPEVAPPATPMVMPVEQAAAIAAPAVSATPVVSNADAAASTSSPPAVEEDKVTESSSGLFLLFQNCQKHFAIAIEYVVEVIKTQPLSAPPYNKKGLSGLLNLRGEVLPILNIQEIATEESQKPVYVVLSQVRDLRFGFQVEAVHQVVSLDPSSFQSVNNIPMASGKEAVSQFCQTDDKTISILHIEDLVAA